MEIGPRAMMGTDPVAKLIDDLRRMGKETSSVEPVKKSRVESKNGDVAPELHKHLKVELLSPGSCVTNDSSDVDDCEPGSGNGEVVASSTDAAPVITKSVGTSAALVLGQPEEQELTPGSSVGSTVETALVAGLFPFNMGNPMGRPGEVYVVDNLDELLHDLNTSSSDDEEEPCVGIKLDQPQCPWSSSDDQERPDPAPPLPTEKKVVSTPAAGAHQIGTVRENLQNVDECRPVSLVLTVKTIEVASPKEKVTTPALDDVLCKTEVVKHPQVKVECSLITNVGYEAMFLVPNVGCEAISLVPNVKCGAMSFVPNVECEALISLVPNVESGAMPLVPNAKAIEVAAPLRGNLVHVKSEPVDSSGDIGAGSSVKELARVEVRNGIVRNPVKELARVKQEVVNPTREHVTCIYTRRAERQPSRNDQSSPRSRNGGGMMAEVSVLSQVRKRADDMILISGRVQKEEIRTRAAHQERRRCRVREEQELIKNKNSNPGMRIQGGRIYDSALGKTCHWCRQKTVEHHVKCRNCTIHFCGPCLMNRNGEDIMAELVPGVQWLCPKCRNGCGIGCDNCCNCGPCRKAGGKAPTGQLIREARNSGFNNVHDYLVHLETDEDADEIAQRKVGKDWTNGGRFSWSDDSDYSDPEDGSSSSDDEELTLNEETSTQLHEGRIGMKFVKKFVQSQNRKRGGMRGAVVPALKRSHIDSLGREPVVSFPARLKAVPQELPSKEAEVASRRIEPRDLVLRASQEESALRASQGNYAFISSPRVEPNDSALKASPGNSVLIVSQGNLALRASQEDSALGSQNSGLRTCKREYVKMDAGDGVGGSEDMAVTKRRKLKGEPYALSSELRTSSRSTSLLGAFAGVKCKVEPCTLSSVTSVANQSNGAGPDREDKITADTPDRQARPSKDSVLESERTLKMRSTSVVNGASQLVSEQRMLVCPSDPQGTEYRMKLKSALARPFDAKELEMLEESVTCRKPLQKIREMRGRTVDVVTADEGFSYLDHHQDFASKLEEAQSPPLKLALLRGFFFWLQHSCMEGAFRPWPGARTSSADCIETEGPDCQVTAIVLQLDEGQDDLIQPGESDHEAHCRLKHTSTAMEERPPLDEVCEAKETKSNSLRSRANIQSLIPFQVKKHPVPLDVKQPVPLAVKQPKMKGQPAGMNYRVVQCLPAPAHNCKK